MHRREYIQSKEEMEVSIEAFRKLWKSGDEAKRRFFVSTLLHVFDHDWKDELDEQLQSLFLPQNYEQLRLRADTSINILSWASEELGGIYAEPATRTIDGN